MLQTFLNRIAKHPKLGKDHVFHQFLETNITWVNIIMIDLLLIKNFIV